MYKQWKNKKINGLDDNDLDINSLEQLNRIENGKNAVLSGQLLEAASKGGEVMGNYLYENKEGIWGMLEEDKKKACSDGGKVAGKLAVENGTVFKAARASINSPNSINKKTSICPHCKKEGAYRIMKRWHMDNCKLKK